ncbi:MAG: lamin tail domain-containing protein [Candidatus Portnoybacteria bacterium]|nr:lamin tail domain-containing protein [Candidatus Portnoybacteria bacterium]
MFRRNKINCSKIIFWLLVIGGFFIWPNFVFGASNDVVINEIAWMGTDISTADEWIELKNTTEGEIDLTGWTLKAVDGTPEITLSGTIAAHGYFLLERTDDSSVPDVAADQIYTGPLGNSGENLELRNAENNLIDSINCSEGWLAGDNTTKQTMEKTDTGWQTSLDVGGTPKALNSIGAEAPPEDGETGEPSGEEPEVEGWIPPTVVNQPPIADAGPDITALVNQEISFDGFLSYDPDNDTLTYFWNFGDGATETEEKAGHIYLFAGQYIVTLMVSDAEFSDLDIITVNIYSQSVIISEFVPNPEGSDTENEWIELFNQSDQIANLTNWQLDDQEGGGSPFIFPANSLIAPHQFLVLRRPITKIALNNDTDQVRLIYPDGSLATEVSYAGENEQGFSVAFDGLDYFWTKIPTPGSANIISSVGLEGQEQNISSNNPQPIIKQTQEAPEILAKFNLNQSQEFSTLSPLSDSFSQLTQKETSQPTQSIPSSQQSASLVQTSQSSQKANLILTLSIIISGSLLVSWFLIRLKKKIKDAP